MAEGWKERIEALTDDELDFHIRQGHKSVYKNVKYDYLLATKDRRQSVKVREQKIQNAVDKAAERTAEQKSKLNFLTLEKALWLLGMICISLLVWALGH